VRDLDHGCLIIVGGQMAIMHIIMETASMSAEQFFEGIGYWVLDINFICYFNFFFESGQH
jgi:hypothetical protein